ncbi:MAG: hypothetical protein ABIK09_12480 [Pseudomonadota bacterium]
MGKASQRRKARRASFMTNLFFQDRKEFDSCWNGRLLQFAREAANRANNLGPGSISVFGVVEEALAELREYGPAPYAAWKHQTRDALETTCAHVLGQVLDRNLIYRGAALWQR